MDKRSRDRKAQHEHHGWRPYEFGESKPARTATEVYMVCPCGWTGWISPDVLK